MYIIVFEDFGIVVVKTDAALEHCRKMPSYRADYYYGDEVSEPNTKEPHASKNS